MRGLNTDLWGKSYLMKPRDVELWSIVRSMSLFASRCCCGLLFFVWKHMILHRGCDRDDQTNFLFMSHKGSTMFYSDTQLKAGHTVLSKRNLFHWSRRWHFKLKANTILFELVMEYECFEKSHKTERQFVGSIIHWCKVTQNNIRMSH